jgi:hypothetical protein
MRRFLIPALTVLLAAALLAAAGCGAQPVVKKVDHVTIECADAQALFDVLNGTLGLPIAWPFSQYPEFATGGVQAGNVNIETLHYGPPGQGGTAIYGIVLEPYPLNEIMGKLEARGAQPSKPEVQKREIAGKTVPFWTNVTLKALCAPYYVVYLCEYTEAARSALDSRKVSGPLGGMGVESVKEIDIISTDAAALRKKWEEVFAPNKMSSDGVMSIGTGPAVRISQGKANLITSLVFQVTSLSKAKAFLEEKGLLGKSTADELTLDPAKVQGLDIRVVQK